MGIAVVQAPAAGYPATAGREFTSRATLWPPDELESAASVRGRDTIMVGVRSMLRRWPARREWAADRGPPLLEPTMIGRAIRTRAGSRSPLCDNMW